ncbi:MAG: riboflavin synthase [Fibrobacteres bacterium]|nr:riboflavin synthase [Fibrobacterota bacterium]
MFTGLVECLGEVGKVESEGANRRFRMLAASLREGLSIGDSIAHNGVCLTVESLQPSGYEVVAVAQTLSVSNLGKIRPGDRVNLERALLPTTRMGGHWVQGHVDGLATVVRSVSRQGSTQWVLRLPKDLVRYCISKGSIALDGISLTLGSVEGSLVEVNIIPHTAKVTTIGTWKPGKTVNVEVDLLAKYVERLLAVRA